MQKEIKYIDTHAHAITEYYGDDLPAVIERALDAQVAIINIGTNMETSRDCVLIVEKFAQVHPHIYSIPGIHPSVISENLIDTSEELKAKLRAMIESDLSSLDELVSKHLHTKGGRGKVVGIGECGIDVFHVDDNLKALNLELQRELFRGQIEIALKYNLPIMVHARESYSEILAILDEDFIGDKSKLRGNIHFFAGTAKDAEMFLKRGFTVSFTGVITFTSAYNEAISAIPLESQMSETDCPYVAPVPHRGKTNEPSFVPFVVSAIAKVKGLDEEECRAIMLKNAEKAYGIDFLA